MFENLKSKLSPKGKPEKKINPIKSRNAKLLVTFIVVLVALIGLSVRIIYIVKVHGAEYTKEVLANQSYDSTIIPFRRGDIVDAKGTVLATSEKVYNIVVDPDTMLTYEDDRYLEPTLRELGNCFPQLDMTEIRSYVLSHEDSHYYIPENGRQLSYSDIAPFLEVQDNNDFVRGVTFEAEYLRVYPNDSLASTFLGYTTNLGNSDGRYGLEQQYNDELTGTDGREYGYQNENSALERTVKEAVDGYTIHTTIDANIQNIVEKYLREFNEKYTDNAHEGNGAENIGCIIMDVNSGEVKAMAMMPDYNPNEYKNTDALLGSMLVEAVENSSGYTEYHTTDTVITQEVIEALKEESGQKQLNANLFSLWKNFCISNTYEPGSTAKPFTVAAALETGAITGDEVYTCNGFLEVGDHKIKCHTYSSGGDGAVTVQDSIAWSCNVALMKIGQAMGRDKFGEFQKIFNFGLKTNVDLYGEARTASLIIEPSQMVPSDLATNTFGQNFNVTMIQMITGFCSLINGGYYYEPHMVDKITNSSGATVENIEPRVLRQTISESTSELIRQYTRATVMEEGGDRRTGKTARPAGYAIGGKTGTAETLPRGNNEYVVSFMGYAPADNPQIAIYVVVDRPNAVKQDDAKFATGIVRNVLTEVLPYMNIYMTEELSEKEIKELEEKQLANTLMYSERVEDSNGAPSGGSAGETVTSGEIIDATGESSRIYPIWMTYPVDSATGYRINPDTGEYLDASTGELVYSDNASLDEDVPVNGNLSGNQTDDIGGVQ